MRSGFAFWRKSHPATGRSRGVLAARPRWSTAELAAVRHRRWTKARDRNRVEPRLLASRLEELRARIRRSDNAKRSIAAAKPASDSKGGRSNVRARGQRRAGDRQESEAQAAPRNQEQIVQQLGGSLDYWAIRIDGTLGDNAAVVCEADDVRGRDAPEAALFMLSADFNDDRCCFSWNQTDAGKLQLVERDTRRHRADAVPFSCQVQIERKRP